MAENAQLEIYLAYTYRKSESHTSVISMRYSDTR